MPNDCPSCGESFPDSVTLCPRDGSPLHATAQSSRLSSDLIGEVIAERYLVTDLLGDGGTGAVYLASDVRLPVQFVLRVLRTRVGDDATRLARFQQEATAVCRLVHDRVARVFDFGVLPDGRPYVIMEYAAGQTLNALVAERGRLDLAEAAKITTMIAEGLEVVHRLGIVHRDLKPENVVVLDDPGGGQRVKVLAFGIARLLEAAEGRSLPGFVTGAPEFMSPEQLLGGAVDARSDVYSMGMLAFLMLTGELAFGGNDAGEMLALMSPLPRTLADVVSTVQWPSALEDALRSALADDPGARPASALEFATLLSRAVVAPLPEARVPDVPIEESPPELQVPVDTPPADLVLDDTTISTGAVRVFRAPEASSVDTARPPVPMAMSFERVPSVMPPTRSDAATPSLSQPATRPAAPASTKGRGTTILAGAAVVLALVATGVVFLSRQEADTGSSAAADKAPPTQPPTQTPTQTPTPAPTLAASPAAAPVSLARDSQAFRRASQARPNTASSAASASTPTSASTSASSAPATSASAELKQLMASYAKHRSASNMRSLLSQLDILQPKLSRPFDVAWSELYVGYAHISLNEKDVACAAFDRAGKVESAPENTLRAGTEARRKFGCPP